MPDPEISPDGLWGGRILHFASLPSTNSRAMQNPASCSHGDIILADDQTDGRGRFQRKWVSEAGRSLTLSFIVDSIRFPSISRQNYAQITALAVRQLLADLKIEAQLKWPNDIMTDRGKICGILAEIISETKVAVGLGINITLEKNHNDILSPYTSIHQEADTVPETSKLIQSLKYCLETAFDNCQRSGLAPLRATWRAHDCLENKVITVNSAKESITGLYKGIDREGLLVLETDGELKTFSSGDVTLYPSPCKPYQP